MEKYGKRCSWMSSRPQAWRWHSQQLVVTLSWLSYLNIGGFIASFFLPEGQQFWISVWHWSVSPLSVTLCLRTPYVRLQDGETPEVQSQKKGIGEQLVDRWFIYLFTIFIQGHSVRLLSGWLTVFYFSLLFCIIETRVCSITILK